MKREVPSRALAGPTRECAVSGNCWSLCNSGQTQTLEPALPCAQLFLLPSPHAAFRRTVKVLDADTSENHGSPAFSRPLGQCSAKTPHNWCLCLTPHGSCWPSLKDTLCCTSRCVDWRQTKHSNHQPITNRQPPAICAKGQGSGSHSIPVHASASDGFRHIGKIFASLAAGIGM